MEAMLAAYGSGAARVSSDQGKRILNIDIGGGTTKLALVENGRVIATAAIHIGGRLQVVDDERPHRPARSGRPASRRAGRAFDWSKGDSADARRARQGRRIHGRRADRRDPHAAAAAAIAGTLSDRADRRPRRASTASCSPAASANTSTAARTAISATWAGGSATRCASASTPARCPGRCCRPANASAPPRSAPPNTACSFPATPATITNPGALLPRRNLQVLQPPYVCEETIDPDKLAAGDPRPFHRLRPDRRRDRGGAGAALARRAVARAHLCVRAGHRARHGATPSRSKKPLYIMLDGDVAQTLGAILREELDVAERDPVHRRRRAVGFRLHRSRPHPPAVDDRAGDDQVAGVQRGPARGRPDQRIHHHEHGTITTMVMRTGMIMATTITITVPCTRAASGLRSPPRRDSVRSAAHFGRGLGLREHDF